MNAAAWVQWRWRVSTFESNTHKRDTGPSSANKDKEGKLRALVPLDRQLLSAGH